MFVAPIRSSDGEPVSEENIRNRSDVAAAADANDGSLLALRRQGAERLKAGQFAEAAELLERAKAIEPGDPQTRLNLGLALQGAERHTEALQYFTDLQNERPDLPISFLYTTASLLALGRPEDALGAANEACRRAPQSPQGLYVQGQALLALNRLPQAEQAFARALQFAPTWADAWVQCGIARYRQGAIEGAKAAMRQALHVLPGHVTATANLQALMRADGEPKANASPAMETRSELSVRSARRQRRDQAERVAPAKSGKFVGPRRRVSEKEAGLRQAGIRRVVASPRWSDQSRTLLFHRRSTSTDSWFFWLGPDAGTPSGGMGRRSLRAAGRAVSHRRLRDLQRLGGGIATCATDSWWTPAAGLSKASAFFILSDTILTDGRGQCDLRRRIS